ncbi:MAG TPA: biotin--[acetyl-CoA-carboxylase] ligase [Thermoanaerobaculia bacterium]|nr:biotin--[acetyl-CoA-carboxylase] ligase [Thermoanaerobaculia bacterium]
MDFDRYVEGLERRRAGRGPENLVVLPRVDSTNTLARAVVAEYKSEAQDFHPLLVLAFEQSGGRGRQGRSWSSPPGKGVYATRVVAVADPAFLQTLPLLVGIGLSRALSAHLPAQSPCRLKWPNDLVVESAGERRKIGGILIEASVQPGEAVQAIVGFGVNHLHGIGELPENATSISLLGGVAVSLADLTWDLVEGVEAELEHLGDSAYAVEAYRGLAIHQPGERIVFRTGGDAVVEGTFVGFDDTGRLQIESGGERISTAAGELIEAGEVTEG